MSNNVPGGPPAPPTKETATKPKKAWYRRWWVWLIAVIVVIGGIGQAISGGTDSRSKQTAASEETTPEETAGEEETVTETVIVPELAGLPGDEADDALQAAGLTAVFESDSGKSVWSPGNWDVISTTPMGGEEVAVGGQVTVLVKDAAERIKAENDQREADRNAAPVDEITAQAFCDNYAALQFPYGVKLHWIVGKLAEEPREGGGWYLKVEATIKNEFNAEQKMNVECHVSGTNGQPAMDEFLAY